METTRKRERVKYEKWTSDDLCVKELCSLCMHLTLDMTEAGSRNEINEMHSAYFNAAINNIMLKKIKTLGQMLNETGFND